MKKKIKVVKKTTCNVLIRDFPVDVSEKLKALRNEKTLSRAVVSSSVEFIRLNEKHGELIGKYTRLRDENDDLRRAVAYYFSSLDILRSTVRKGDNFRSDLDADAQLDRDDREHADNHEDD